MTFVCVAHPSPYKESLFTAFTSRPFGVTRVIAQKNLKIGSNYFVRLTSFGRSKIENQQTSDF
jgi:hypothetical protein